MTLLQDTASLLDVHVQQWQFYKLIDILIANI